MSFYGAGGRGSSVFEQESIISDSPDQIGHHHHHQEFDDSELSSPSRSRLSSLVNEDEEEEEYDEDDAFDDIFEYGDLGDFIDMDDEESLFVNGFEEDDGPIDLSPLQQTFAHILPRSSSPIVNQQPPIYHHRRANPNPNPPAEVVDLTADNSSPGTGNQRNQNNLVIDLISSDSDEDLDIPAARPRRTMASNLNNNNINHNNNNNNNPGRQARPPQHHHHHHHHHHHQRRQQEPQDRTPHHLMSLANFIQNIPHIPMLNFFNNAASIGERASAAADDLAIVGERHLPINIGMLDYGHNAFRAHQNPGVSPRPAHEPPKPAREGFTRDTGEDVIAICPSCDQELAYDPDADVDGDGPPPAKRPRTKRDKAEHHFFAIKACGHVYCRKCYDYRKPTVRNPVNVGFRPDPKGNKGKILCAVDDCESEVSNKTAWVGIFL